MIIDGVQVELARSERERAETEKTKKYEKGERARRRRNQKILGGVHSSSPPTRDRPPSPGEGPSPRPPPVGKTVPRQHNTQLPAMQKGRGGREGGGGGGRCRGRWKIWCWRLSTSDWPRTPPHPTSRCRQVIHSSCCQFYHYIHNNNSIH
jgi:hypothetical protein